ncbi:4178_t:CDS:2, partial [Funneliformis caledonium]
QSSRTSTSHLHQTVLLSIILSKFVKDLKREIRVSEFSEESDNEYKNELKLNIDDIKFEEYIDQRNKS